MTCQRRHVTCQSNADTLMRLRVMICKYIREKAAFLTHSTTNVFLQFLAEAEPETVLPRCMLIPTFLVDNFTPNIIRTCFLTA